MRREVCGLALVLLLSAPATALADSVFSLNGTLADGGTFSGTLRVDSQGSGFLQGTVLDGANSFTLPANYLGEQLGYPTYTSVDAFPVLQPLFDLEVVLPAADLTTYGGGSLCSLTTVCAGAFASSFSDAQILREDFATLTATPTVTPEPATLALFGTGLLGLVGAVRRRAVR